MTAKIHSSTATAAEAHKIHRETVERNIVRLTEWLEAQKDDETKDWADVGSMFYVSEKLSDISEFAGLDWD